MSAAFLPKFQKLAHPYPTNFSKLNYIKPTSQLSRSKYRISVRGPTLWNEFLINSEIEIKNLSFFKSKVKKSVRDMVTSHKWGFSGFFPYYICTPI